MQDNYTNTMKRIITYVLSRYSSPFETTIYALEPIQKNRYFSTEIPIITDNDLFSNNEFNDYEINSLWDSPDSFPISTYWESCAASQYTIVNTPIKHQKPSHLPHTHLGIKKHRADASVEEIETGIMTIQKVSVPIQIEQSNLKRLQIEPDIRCDEIIGSIPIESSLNKIRHHFNQSSLHQNSSHESSLTETNFSLLADAYNIDPVELNDTLTSLTTSNKKSNSSSDNENQQVMSLTPAQQFFAENRDILIQRAQQYHHLKQLHFEQLPEELNQTYDTFYRDPVIRPPRGHAWDFGNAQYHIPREEVELEEGRMPSIQALLKILEQERIADVRVIDLTECGRRDLGLFFIIGTGQTGHHCERVAKMITKIIRHLHIPYVSDIVYCWGSSSDCWMLSHCGALQLHILTNEMRKKFRLETLLLAPHEHFTANKFPGYFDCLATTPPPYVIDHIKMLQARNEMTSTVFITDDSTMNSF